MTPSDRLHRLRIREEFEVAAREPDERIDVPRVALLIAAEMCAPFDIDHYLSRFDELAIAARDRIAGSGAGVIETLNRFLFDEVGFSGNRDNYYDPHNSFLNVVLDRRLGIPLTLSLVYMEVGRRVGLTVEGVGLPGHFVVRAKAAGSETAVMVDAFNCAIIDQEDCQSRIDAIYGGKLTLCAEHLRTVSNRDILVRMLTNLKAIYLKAHMHEQALSVVDRILFLKPDSVDEYRDRGVLYAELERLTEAIADTEVYMKRAPNAADAEDIKEQLSVLRRKMSMLN